MRKKVDYYINQQMGHDTHTYAYYLNIFVPKYTQLFVPVLMYAKDK